MTLAPSAVLAKTPAPNKSLFYIRKQGLEMGFGVVTGWIQRLETGVGRFFWEYQGWEYRLAPIPGRSPKF